MPILLADAGLYAIDRDPGQHLIKRGLARRWRQ